MAFVHLVKRTTPIQMKRIRKLALLINAISEKLEKFFKLTVGVSNVEGIHTPTRQILLAYRMIVTLALKSLSKMVLVKGALIIPTLSLGELAVFLMHAIMARQEKSY